MELTEPARTHLADKGYNPEMGARPLRRLIQNEVEEVLSDGFLAGTYVDNSRILIDALDGKLIEQIQYAFSNELVSTDVIGNPCPSVFDSQATIVSPDQQSIVLYVWYDNEYGYSSKLIDLAVHISKI